MFIFDFPNDDRDIQPFRVVLPGAVLPLIDLDSPEVQERLKLFTLPGQEGVDGGFLRQDGFTDPLEESFPEARD